MKMISKITIVFLFGIVKVFAEPVTAPPAPVSTAKNAGITPPDTPIDNNLLLLVIVALLLGIYVIYKYRLNAKASM
jgi:hypothetical protein